MAFNRSAWMRERHKTAKKERAYFQSQFRKELPYHEFLRKKSPLAEQIIAYDVSFQISYRGKIDELYITGKTFTVYGLKGSESDIENKAIDMVINSKGKITESPLNKRTITAIENAESGIEVKPRGLEPSGRELSRDKILNVIENKYFVENLDNIVTIKNKKGQKGELKLDTSFFK